MGNYFAKNMEKNIHKQLQIQEQMRQKQIATMIAGQRELFLWYSSFYVTVAVLGISGFLKKKNPAFLAPLLPLTFVLAYQADLAYGDKLHRIRNEAERILQFENGLLRLPLGPPIIPTTDFTKIENEEQKK